MGEIKKMQQEKIEIEQRKDGSVERTQTKKEVTQQQGDPNGNAAHELEDRKEPYNNYDRNDFDFDFGWVLWAVIAGAIIFFVWRRSKD